MEIVKDTLAVGRLLWKVTNMLVLKVQHLHHRLERRFLNFLLLFNNKKFFVIKKIDSRKRSFSFDENVFCDFCQKKEIAKVFFSDSFREG